MSQVEFSNLPKSSKLDGISRDELIQRNFVLEFELSQLIKENYELRNIRLSSEQMQLVMNDQLDSLRKKIFGRSSERYKKPDKKDDDSQPKDPKPRVKKPSERYPHLPVKEEHITLDPAPACPCCSKVMTDSGMTEDSEQLTVIPKKYEITLQKRAKYRCSCHGSIITAPSPARIIPGSTYSDEMIQDIALSKYCDLIPMQRYASMAARAGLVDLPSQSLIETTHQLADFLTPVYALIKKGIQDSRVLRADETPHRMLEGDEKKSWYLWGFSTDKLCFLECHDNRSGDRAIDILSDSNCKILLCDVFSGYTRAIKEINNIRELHKKPLITCAHCNAHARRYFFNAFPKYPEATFYLDHYHEIYQLNGEAKSQASDIVLKLREQMRPRFEAMREQALKELPSYPRNGVYGKALRYFLNKYQEFTLFLTDPDIPIDNNAQERNLRSHVVGRKTWYGTHSERGARTAAKLFSIIETCKLNQVNPREYFSNLTHDLLAGAQPYTPVDFKKSN